MKQKHRIFGKELWTEMMMSFFVCTACICILEGVVGTLFMPRQQFGYEAFFSPPLFGAVSVLFGIVTRSRRELSMGEVVARRCLHLLLIEALRQKEQFSDGVGYSWIDTLKEITSKAVTDEQMAHAAERFPINTPLCKEEYYYRSIFEEHFPSESAARAVPHEASVACSTAKALEWDEAWKNMNDPSGRAVSGVHEQAYE